MHIKKILVTGGAGYIGSHACVELLNSGYKVIVIDNLSNSNEESIKRVQKITKKKIQFVKADLLDKEALLYVFEKNNIDAVIHFAGLKAVGESEEKPLLYYQNNVIGTINLCQAMIQHNVKNIVFSSSATVYGSCENLPINENSKTAPKNTYGRTKLIIENFLEDIKKSDHDWGIQILRYFNPVGAHDSGLIGEDPKGVPNNLMPYVAQVALGSLEIIPVYGNDYSTKDGTGVRDYIHVVDLAKGHIKALENIAKNSGYSVLNLGTGRGYSVIEIIDTFKKVSGVDIPYKVTERRKGDVAASYANVTLAQKELDWIAEKSLEKMCEDTWNWQKNNPNGYV